MRNGLVRLPNQPNCLSEDSGCAVGFQCTDGLCVEQACYQTGSEIVMDVTLPALETSGRYRVIFDIVAEQVLWFANRDSVPAELTLEVTESRR